MSKIYPASADFVANARKNEAAYRAEYAKFKAEVGAIEPGNPKLMDMRLLPDPDKVRIREGGVKYEVDFAEGHKTGASDEPDADRPARIAWVSGWVIGVLLSVGGRAGRRPRCRGRPQRSERSAAPRSGSRRGRMAN